MKDSWVLLLTSATVYPGLVDANQRLETQPIRVQLRWPIPESAFRGALAICHHVVEVLGR